MLNLDQRQIATPHAHLMCQAYMLNVKRLLVEQRRRRHPLPLDQFRI